MSGISFDRAATFYDATRGLPPAVRDELAQVLARELAGRGRCLEIGVGTGRVALPLAARAIDLIGIDLAPAMLDRLRQNAGSRAAIPLALADATALPFAPRSLDAVLSSHVLHLVADWPRAVDEARRVLKPGGVLLVDFGGGTPAPWDQMARAVMAQHQVFRVRPGLSDPDVLAGYLSDARRRPLEPIRLQVRATLAGDLDDWEHQLYAWTWPYRADQMREACGQIRREAEAGGWALDEEVTLERVIQWWAFDLAG